MSMVLWNGIYTVASKRHVSNIVKQGVHKKSHEHFSALGVEVVGKQSCFVSKAACSSSTLFQVGELRGR